MSFIKHGSTHDNAKGVIALFCVLLAFNIFMLFYNNQQNIIASGSLNLFLALATGASALFLILYYLVSKDTEKKTKASFHKTKSPAKSAKKKKR